MKKSDAGKMALVLLVLSGAVFMLYRFLSRSDGISEKTFFYDQSEKKLFAVSREELPPIKGLNNAEEDAVRAVVISLNGNPKDEKTRKIAYLEKYAPEFKDHLAKVRTGQVEAMARGTRDQYRFVKRVEDSQWYTVSSPEGEKILAEWNVPGPNGKYPVVCSP